MRRVQYQQQSPFLIYYASCSAVLSSYTTNILESNNSTFGEGGCSLLWSVVGEVNALGDIALKAFNSLTQQLLLFLGQAFQRIGSIFSAVGLKQSQLLCSSGERNSAVVNILQVQLEQRRSRIQSPWQFRHPLARLGDKRNLAQQGPSHP